MARRYPGIERVLGPDAVAAIVYGTISSSLYFALGVVALWALDLTPVVLLGVGLLFALAATAYAEAASAFAEPGGAAGVARRAFGDAAGFLIGWVVLLDFAVVIALALLFVPHYAAAAVGEVGGVDSPLDQYIAFGLVVLAALWHLRGRPGLRLLAIGASAIDLIMQLLVAALGIALVVDPRA